MQRLRLAVWVAAIGAAGCGAPPAHIAQGEAYTTGSADFDEFLTAVKYVRADGLAAPSDEVSAHAGLIKALGLASSSAPAQALEEAGARARKLRDKGVLLHLEIAPEPKLLTAKGRTDLGADGDALLKAMEDAARASLDLRKRLAAVATRAADLEKKRQELRAQASTAFGQEPVKRDQVLLELDAAKTVLADASDAATRSAGAAARFVVELVQAVETGAGGAPSMPGRGKKGPATMAGKAAGPRASAPASPAPAAPAPPPKKAKGGDDFEP